MIPRLTTWGELKRQPHTFGDGSLCVHQAHEWHGNKLIAETIIPWASTWLAFYETWLHTGCWLGEGTHPGLPEHSQFNLWPLDVFFEFNWIFICMSWGLMALTIFERLFPSLKNIHAGYTTYVEAPLVIACLIWAALILGKFLLLGIGNGWDTAGLSLSHAIYISAGSFKQQTEIYTLMPKNERKFWVSHIAIHDRDDVCEKVDKLLKVSLSEEI